MSASFARDPATLQRLSAMGEWMAAGFYEALDEPWPRPYGRAYRRLYERMELRLDGARLLIPSEPFPVLGEYARRPGESSWFWGDTGDKGHHPTGFICDFMHSCGLHLNREVLELKRAAHPQDAAFLEALVADLAPRLPHFGGYTHSNPDIRRIVEEGFAAMAAEVDAGLAAARAEGAGSASVHLLEALQDYCRGVAAFHRRTVEAAREAARRLQNGERALRERIAESFAGCFMQPAKDFLSGLLAARFAWLLDGCDSLGRLDQALGPLLERDLDSGALDLSLARRLLDELFRDFERFNGWNLQIGGRRWEDGRDGCNRLTLELLEACARLKFRKPSIAFRVTSDTPRPALARALAVLGRGSGRPALYNDDLYVRSLLALDLGLTERDAREIGFGGCTETMIAGLSNVGSLDGGLNLALALSLALNDGRDPLNGEQAGPATGAFTDFADFTAFKAAVEGQIRHQVENLTGRLTKALRQRFTQGDPKLFRTMLTRDCVRRGLSFEAGGARYNWSVISLSGVADLIDGLAAVRHCVFETRTVSREALLAALAADFAGFEEVRRHLLAAPRFGNDLPEVDELGAGILDFTCRALLSHLTPRGGRFVPSVINFTTYAEAGRKVGALPDGRRAGEPLADSIGPKAGRDVHGPTAMLRSVARLPGCLMAGTPVLNLRLHPRLLNHQEGRERCVDLVRTFFDLGGLQIQITAADREVLRAAQRDPESHRDLIVRIGGYSEYFTQLSPALQETVIERTEHGSA